MVSKKSESKETVIWKPKPKPVVVTFNGSKEEYKIWLEGFDANRKFDSRIDKLRKKEATKIKKVIDSILPEGAELESDASSHKKETKEMSTEEAAKVIQDALDIFGGRPIKGDDIKKEVISNVDWFGDSNTANSSDDSEIESLSISEEEYLEEMLEEEDERMQDPAYLQYLEEQAAMEANRPVDTEELVNENKELKEKLKMFKGMSEEEIAKISKVIDHPTPNNNEVKLTLKPNVATKL